MTGKQQGSDVWVMGPNVQINGKGELIREEDHPYYWHQRYTPGKDAGDEQKLIPLPISLPLQKDVSFMC